MKKVAIIGIFIFSALYSFATEGQSVSMSLQYIDTQTSTYLQLTPSWAFPFRGPALFEVTSDTNTNDTMVNCRFSLADHDNLE